MRRRPRRRLPNRSLVVAQIILLGVLLAFILVFHDLIGSRTSVLFDTVSSSEDIVIDTDEPSTASQPVTNSAPDTDATDTE